MGLLKCADCGKMVSERASMCPYCACPREYFINESEKKEVVVGNNTQDLIEFVLADGYKVSYDASVKRWAPIYGEYLCCANLGVTTLREKYAEVGNISDAMKIIPDLAMQYIDIAVEATTQTLYKADIPLTIDDFYEKYERKYRLDYVSYIEPIIDEYEDILQVDAELKRARAIEKAQRGRWEGGGFGLKGALKGAATATLLNAGSDLIHSFGDASKENADNALIASKLSKLYSNPNTVETLCNSVHTVITNIFFAVWEELCIKNNEKVDIFLDIKGADALYKTTLKYASSEEERTRNFVKCIQMDIGNELFYVPIILKLMEDGTDFEKFVDFWNIRPIFEKYFTTKEKALASRKIAESINYFAFDLKNNSPENVAYIKKQIDDLFIQSGTDFLKDEFYGPILKDYFEHAQFSRGLLSMYSLNEYIEPGTEIFTFFKYLRRNREYYPKAEACKAIWMLGDYQADFETQAERRKHHPVFPSAKNKAELTNGNSVVIVFLDESFDYSMSQGFALTTEELIDFKTKRRIPVREVSIIEVSKNEANLIVGNENYSFKILRDGNFLRECDTLQYFANILRFIMVNLLGNTLLWDERMATPMPDAEDIRRAENLSRETIERINKAAEECKNAFIQQMKEKERIREERILQEEARDSFDDQFDTYMYEHGIKLSDFRNCDYARAIEINKVFCSYFESHEQINYNSLYRDRLDELWKSIDNKYPWNEVLANYKLAPDTSSLEDYFVSFIVAQINIGRYIYGDIYVGSLDDFISERKAHRYLDSDDAFIGIYDTSLFENASKGLGITMKCLIDLRTKRKFEYGMIRNVEVLPDYNIRISSENSMMLVETSKYNGLSCSLANLLKALCILFGNNEYIGSDKDTCNDEKVNVQERKLITQEAVKTVETVFCTKCGSKISRTAKFCNFCGNENKYCV